jgi:hypothetical protein
MGLGNKFKRFVAVAAVMAAAYGCGSHENASNQQRYHIEPEKGGYALVDASTSQKRIINEGVAATIDDAIAAVENENGSEHRFSKDYRMRVAQSVARNNGLEFWEYFVEQDKRELSTKYLQSLPEDEQISLLAGPLKEKAASAIKQIRSRAAVLYKDMTSYAYQGSQAITEVCSREKIMQSYDQMRKMHEKEGKNQGGGQN